MEKKKFFPDSLLPGAHSSWKPSFFAPYSDVLLQLSRKGYGTISAAGGRGWGGGGGGRISLDCYSIQEDVKVTVHGLCSSGFCIGIVELVVYVLMLLPSKNV